MAGSSRNKGRLFFTVTEINRYEICDVFRETLKMKPVLMGIQKMCKKGGHMAQGHRESTEEADHENMTKQIDVRGSKAEINKLKQNWKDCKNRIRRNQKSYISG